MRRFLRNKMSCMLLSVFIIGIVMVSQTQAASININLWNNDAGDVDNNTVNSGESAGVIPIGGDFWNNIGFEGGNHNFNLSQAIMDDQGNATAATFTSTLGSGWVGFSGAANTTTKNGNRDMMSSYLSFDNSIDTGNLSVTGLGSSFTENDGGYDVYIYSDADNNARLFNVTVNGQTLNISDSATYNGAFNEGGSGVNENYAVFRNLTADAITIEMASTPGRGAINGIQIVSSEPPPLPLQLLINTVTGETSIENLSGNAYAMDYYHIRSNSGQLRPSRWSSLEDQDFEGQGPANGSGNGWEELHDTADWLAEGFLLDNSAIADQQSIKLGQVFAPTTDEQSHDLQFLYETENGDFVEGAVEYVTPDILIGDFNGDSLIDSADWLIFSTWYNTDLSSQSVMEGYERGDINFDGIINRYDFSQFKITFNAINGEGAFAIMQASVPEPATLVLLGLGLGIMKNRNQYNKYNHHMFRI